MRGNFHKVGNDQKQILGGNGMGGCNEKGLSEYTSLKVRPFFTLFLKMKEVKHWNGSYIAQCSGNTINLLSNDFNRVFEIQLPTLEKSVPGMYSLKETVKLQLRQEVVVWED